MISDVQIGNLSGQPELKYFRITYEDLNATAGTSKTLTLFTLQKGGLIIWCKAKTSTAFGGGAISDMSCVIGVSGATNCIMTDLDIDAAVADTTCSSGVPATPASLGQSAKDIICTIGSTGANLTALTAGVLEVWILVYNTPTPGVMV